MQSAVVQMIFIAVGLAAAAIVSFIIYSQLGKNAPEETDTVDFSKITSQTLCDAVGGTWTNGTPGSCAKKN